MEQHAIELADARAAVEVAAPPGTYYWGGWVWLSADQIAWTAAYTKADRLKYGGFVLDLATQKVKTLSLPGGWRGPALTGTHLVAGGGANGATPAAFDRVSWKKSAGLKGHKSQLNGLASVGGDMIATIGGKNSRPFDDTLRLWDATSFQPVEKIKLPGRPQTVATSNDRIYVRTWRYQEGTELHAFDRSGSRCWSRDDGEPMNSVLAVSGDGQTVAQILGLELRLLDRDGAVRVSVKPAMGSKCSLAFSADDRWLFVSDADGGSTHRGTRVVEVATGESRMHLNNVVGLQQRQGGELGGWFGAQNTRTHFVALAASYF